MAYFVFRPAYPPPLSAGAGLGNRASHLCLRTVGFRVIFLLFHADPPRSEPEAIWATWLLILIYCGTGQCDVCACFLGDPVSPRPPSLGLRR